MHVIHQIRDTHRAFVFKNQEIVARIGWSSDECKNVRPLVFAIQSAIWMSSVSCLEWVHLFALSWTLKLMLPITCITLLKSKGKIVEKKVYFVWLTVSSFLRCFYNTKTNNTMRDDTLVCFYFHVINWAIWKIICNSVLITGSKSCKRK